MPCALGCYIYEHGVSQAMLSQLMLPKTDMAVWQARLLLEVVV